MSLGTCKGVIPIVRRPYAGYVGFSQGATSACGVPLVSQSAADRCYSCYGFSLTSCRSPLQSLQTGVQTLCYPARGLRAGGMPPEAEVCSEPTQIGRDETVLLVDAKLDNLTAIQSQKSTASWAR